MDIKEGLKYTKSHEWIRVEGDEAFIGISAHAQEQLGDVVFVEVETEGEELNMNEAFGSIEAVKTVSDVNMPVGGKVLEVNEKLEDAPDLINKDPYGDGWIIKIKIANKAELDQLMDADAYKASL
jgi:glycine cleavage system H protein